MKIYHYGKERLQGSAPIPFTTITDSIFAYNLLKHICKRQDRFYYNCKFKIYNITLS